MKASDMVIYTGHYTETGLVHKGPYPTIEAARATRPDFITKEPGDTIPADKPHSQMPNAGLPDDLFEATPPNRARAFND